MADESDDEIAALKARLAALEAKKPAPAPGPAMTQQQAQGCLWAVGLAVIAVIALVATCSGKPKDPAKAAQETADGVLISSAKAALRQRAKDPDSVKFGDVTVMRLPGAKPTACGSFNAKNGFGGYAGSSRFFYSSATASTMVEDDNPDVFAILWKFSCGG